MLLVLMATTMLSVVVMAAVVALVQARQESAVRLVFPVVVAEAARPPIPLLLKRLVVLVDAAKSGCGLIR